MGPCVRMHDKHVFPPRRFVRNTIVINPASPVG
jgi:hypothetical protein